MVNAIKEYQVTYDLHSGFWQTLGIPSRGAKLYQILHQGIPYPVFAKLATEAGLELKALAGYLVIPQATLQRRAKLGRFKLDESDRLYRFAVILKAATDLFEGDKPAAQQWLQNPVRGLGGRCPVQMLATSAEAEAVLDLIGRLEHGVFA